MAGGSTARCSATRLGPSAATRWLLIVNLGRDTVLDPAAEPLLAPPASGKWALRWSSEHPRYGGAGIPDPLADGDWRLPGRAAVLFTARPAATSP